MNLIDAKTAAEIIAKRIGQVAMKLGRTALAEQAENTIQAIEKDENIRHIFYDLIVLAERMNEEI